MKPPDLFREKAEPEGIDSSDANHQATGSARWHCVETSRALGPHVPHVFVAALETLVSVGSKTDLQEKGEIYRASKGSPYK